ncbi:NAD-dependent epimerase/dehydratase family protein [Parafrigoribacterium soli]|uniref:NAD-dependent epimerase/dehydratase family protein n=1 Tax=Parafrigoribacterium soli TaxID=3144663 RepID=UPI0032F07426
MTVLIAGCGDLGTEAGLRFVAAGHRVVGWRRNPQHLPAAIEGVAVDLTATLPTIAADTRIVVIATAAGERSEAGYRAAYLDAAGKVLDALDRDGIRADRVLYVSSTAVYGDQDGLVDEATPASPATATARVLLETEELLHSRRPDAIVLRLSGIYGPGRTRLIDQVKSGTARIPSVENVTNRVHRDDAAEAIVYLTTRVQSPEALYLGSDNEPVELGEVLSFLATEMGREHPPMDDDTASALTKRCSNALLRGTGFEFAYPSFREGYRAVLAGHGLRHP